MFRYLFTFLFFLIAPPLAAQEPLVLDLRHSIDILDGDRKVRICAHKAETVQDRTVGLMFQENLPEKGGMIFDFKKNDIVHMWMRNTVLPLDMIFIGETGKIVKIAENTKPFSLDIISSDVPARHVLEVNAGTARKFSIQKGHHVVFETKKCNLE